MDREIKFRAMRKDQHFKGWLHWQITDGFSSPRDTIDVETICQYTGLKDKNGKEIYEGDIVTFVSPTNIGRVVYRKAMFEILWTTGRNDPLYGSNDTEMEVIGNIYENPDLIEEKENGL